VDGLALGSQAVIHNRHFMAKGIQAKIIADHPGFDHAPHAGRPAFGAEKEAEREIQISAGRGSRSARLGKIFLPAALDCVHLDQAVLCRRSCDRLRLSIDCFITEV